MPTNEERKEIAKWLRSLADTGGYSHRDDRLLGEILGSVHLKRGNIDEVLRLFADLIEPEERTCQPVEPFDKETKHVVERGQNYYYWPYLGCPECQCDFPQGSKFCPNCGCRVKEETDAAE